MNLRSPDAKTTSRIAVSLLIAAWFGIALQTELAFAQTEIHDDDLRMAGECGALGFSIMQNASAFKERHWREAGLVLMLAPMMLADAKLDVPFKDHPSYKQALEKTQGELASQPASTKSPAYANRLKPCLEWADKLEALAEKSDGKN